MNTKLIASIIVLILLLAFCNCGQPGNLILGPAAPALTSNSNDRDQGNLPNGTPGGGAGNTAPGQNETINNMKPALAVRATGCIMCHSNIKSNIITDFGYGNSYFFGGYPGTLPANLANTRGGSIYGDYDFSQGSNVNWGGSTIKSGTQVIVPHAPTEGLNVSKATLSDYLTDILSNNSNATGVTAKVVNSVLIGAPTAQRIISLSGVESGKMKFIPSNGTALSGIYAADEGNGYFRNIKNETIVCDGDLIIDGVLWLDQPSIKTVDGCRIYATGSVFISAPLEYIEVKERSNLQVSSAKMVALGLGRNCTGEPNSHSINERLVPGASSDQSRFNGFFTRNLGAPLSMLGSLKADTDKVPGLIDATCTPGGRSSGFDRLLVNAPVIHNRYQGQFKGLIISEIALLALNSLKYEFDPVFSNEKVRILPLLKPADYLEIKE